MTSAPRGSSTSAPEIANVTPHGVRLSIDGREVFLDFEHFPWFRDASIGQIANVTRPSADHLHWPDLDVDLSVESIGAPDEYPLRSQVRAAREDRS